MCTTLRINVLVDVRVLDVNLAKVHAQVAQVHSDHDPARGDLRDGRVGLPWAEIHLLLVSHERDAGAHAVELLELGLDGVHPHEPDDHHALLLCHGVAEHAAVDALLQLLHRSVFAREAEGAGVDLMEVPREERGHVEAIHLLELGDGEQQRPAFRSRGYRV